jgi:hypothetical protein
MEVDKKDGYKETKAFPINWQKKDKRRSWPIPEFGHPPAAAIPTSVLRTFRRRIR